MPHKHTRRGGDRSTIDLPPSVVAQPLPVSKSAKNNGIFASESGERRKSNKRKRNTEDDTPKAFARLMAFRDGKKIPSGLDDGSGIPKKKKREKTGDERTIVKKAAVSEQIEEHSAPKIRPGESMSEFSARVDAALPISGLKTKGGKDPLGLKPTRTRKEQKMHKMYAEWREQDRKIKERRQEELELAQEEEEENVELGVKWKVDMEAAEQGKKKGKGKRKRMIGEVDDGDDDPWAGLAKARGEGPRKLNDVAAAPPQFTKLPKEKFKVRGARVQVDDVPRSAGSLRRREELGEVRKSIVESYRQLMEENRAAL